jgi:hypothetical protein
MLPLQYEAVVANDALVAVVAVVAVVALPNNTPVTDPVTEPVIAPATVIDPVTDNEL